MKVRLVLKTSGIVGEIISIYDNGIGVKCSDTEIIITKLKPSGKKEMTARDFINGRGKDKLLGEKNYVRKKYLIIKKKRKQKEKKNWNLKKLEIYLIIFGVAVIIVLLNNIFGDGITTNNDKN
ncbi:MAG: hypothetical protein L6V81_05560 [Clostridium sp.]|nr:MAG: hypothetical protein L6V81_05560 [Clostridium sp.]